jgi:alpha-tubulin suppressor-like RCC1 family protein
MVLIGWGSNGCGVLGDGTTEDQSAPHICDDDVSRSFVSVHLGGTFAIAVSVTNELYQWGNGFGDEKDTIITKPRMVDLRFKSAVRCVACGWESAMVVLEDNSVWSIGNNGLNENSTSSTFKDITSSVPITGEAIKKIAIGYQHFVLLTNSGKLYGWGNNRNGQIGGCGSKTLKQITSIDVEDGVQIVDVACGMKHSVFLDQTGYVWICGSNSFGQLGIDSQDRKLSSSKLQKAVLDVEQQPVVATSISSGWQHVAVRSDDGGIYTWGKNRYGQLGLGDFEDRFAAIPVDFPDDAKDGVKQVCCGSEHTITFSGSEMWSWGWNEHGNLGHGDRENRNRPTKVDFLSSLEVDLCQSSVSTSASAILFLTFPKKKLDLL